MLENGLLVAMGLLFTLAKLSWPRKMWVVSHPLQMDLIVFVLLTMLHWGTFSGVMVATIGALFCSMTLSVAKWFVGYIDYDKNRYYAGLFNVLHKLKE